MNQAEAEAINSKFYTRFAYPWHPRMLTVPTSAGHGTLFLNQTLGCWRQVRMPRDMRIWVAGCGTNQAVLLALNFPEAKILATDISPGSLAASKSFARQLGVENIEFRLESIEKIEERAFFHYVVCTGVAHHNPDPAALLKVIAAALRIDGVLELMVYNRFHRTQTTAFQTVVKLLTKGREDAADLECQMALVRGIIESCPEQGSMRGALRGLDNAPEEAIADALLQPVELSFTIDSLDYLLAQANLRMRLPCVNQFDLSERRSGWEMQFTSTELEARYAALPTVTRWSITNYLLLERSPMLWFYVDRADSPHPLPNCHALTEAFLATRFERYAESANLYLDDGSGALRQTSRIPLPSPAAPRDDKAREIWQAADPSKTMGEILESLGIHNRVEIDALRVGLSTMQFPYLRAAAVKRPS